MNWSQWLAIIALAICLGNCLYHFYRIISLGNPPEYARRAGHIGKAVRYSFTGAMSPKVKESAYLHMPTYLAGIIYHIGTFLSIILFFLFLMNVAITGWIQMAIVAILGISTLCGAGILIKRISHHELKTLSNPDDYISNLLVTLLQFLSAYTLYLGHILPLYFIVAGILLLYLPIGKLKHTIYFFAARYHLGFFFGWRGVWPPK